MLTEPSGAMARLAVVTAGAADLPESNIAVPARIHRIDDDRDRVLRAADLGAAALDELGRRRVDHAADPLHGGAAEGQGLGIVASLEDQDAGVGPAGGRGQADRSAAAERDRAEGAAVGRAVVAGAEVEDGDIGAADGRGAGDPQAAALEDDRGPRGDRDDRAARGGEAAALDDVGAGGQRHLGGPRDADLAVDAGLDRRGRAAADGLRTIVRQAGGNRRQRERRERVGDRPWLPVTGCGLSVGLPLFLTPPTTWMPPAFTEAAPLIVRALDELESTITLPGTLMPALPDKVSARRPLGPGRRSSPQSMDSR